MRAEHLLHASALHTDAAPVHQTDRPQACRVRFAQVRIHDIGDVARRKRVEVELRADGDDVGIAHAISQRRTPNAKHLGRRSAAREADYFVYVAVTLVRMPPRGVKSPTTVMRTGEHAATRSSRI